MSNKFSELFDQKLKELTPNQFHFWLCGAYGVFEATTLQRCSPTKTYNMLKENIDVSNIKDNDITN